MRRTRDTTGGHACGRLGGVAVLLVLACFYGGIATVEVFGGDADEARKRAIAGLRVIGARGGLLGRVPAEPLPVWPGVDGAGGRAGPVNVEAILETNPDADARLVRLTQYLADGAKRGDYESALQLAEMMRREHGRTLTRSGGGLFLPADRMVRRMLLAGSVRDPRLLKQYRMEADAAARGVLGGEPGDCRDEAKLRAVAQRYFLSNVGDEAAYVLGCLLMDSGRFAEAASRFARVWREHPDPTVDGAALLSRWAVAAGRMGDEKRARWALARLRAEAGVEARMVGVAEAAVADAGSNAGGREGTGWTMRGGGPDRAGVMPPVSSLGDGGGPVELVAGWRDRFPPAAPEGWWGGLGYRIGSAAGTTPGDLAERGRTHGWTPVGQVLHDPSRLYYRTHDAVVCRDRVSGQTLWLQRRPKESLTVADPQTTEPKAVPYAATAEEILAFEDALGKRMTLIDGRLYYVERNDRAGWVDERTLGNWAANGQRMTVGNALVALDAATGETLWRRGRTAPPEVDSPLGVARFLAPPVEAAGRLVTLVERDEQIVLVGLRPETGEVVFESFICAVETRDWPWWSAAALAVDASRVYGLFGRGVVFAASIEDGSLRWARTYRRSDARQPKYVGRKPLRQAGVPGWASNGLCIVGGVLVATPYDAESVLLIDRRTGRPAVSVEGLPDANASTIEARGARHVIGVRGRRLVAAVGDAIVAFDVEAGALAWRAAGIRPTGRAAMTERAIYVPVEDRIVQLSPQADGKRVRMMNVDDHAESALGNLFSTGEELVAFSPGIVEGLRPPRRLLATLEARLQQSPTAENYLIRGGVLARLGRDEAAVADYRRAYRLAGSGPIRRAAGKALADRLLAMAHAGTDDAEALARLDEAREMVDAAPMLAARVDLARARLQRRSGAIEEAVATYQSLIVDARHAADSDETSGSLLVSVVDRWGERRVDVASLAARELAALAIAERARVMPAMVDDSRVALARARAALRSVGDRSEGREAVRRLAHVTRLFPTTPAAMQAIERLGRHERQIGLARPRHVLRRLAEAKDAPTAARATAALANLHAGAGWTLEARRQWRGLGDRFGERAMLWDGRVTTGLALSDRMLGELGVGGLEPPHRTPRPPWRKQWHLPGQDTALVAFTDDPRSAFERNHALLFHWGDGSVSCLALDQLTADGEPRWRVRDRAIRGGGIDEDGRPRFAGWLGGDGMLIWGRRAVRCYDLLSGEQLWRSPRPDGLPIGRDGVRALHAGRTEHGYSRLAVDREHVLWRGADGVGRSELVMRDAVSGRVRWRRSIEDGALSGVALSGPYAVAVLNEGRGLRTFGKETGEPIGTSKLDHAPERIAWAGRFALVQRHSELRCVDLGDGAARWRAQIHRVGNKATFGVLGNGAVWLHDQQGGLTLRDEPTSEPSLTFHRNGNARCVDLALTPDGSETVAIWRLGDRFEVSIFERRTGHEKSRITISRNGLPRSSPTAASLAWAEGPVPRAVLERRNNRSTGRHAVQLFRRADGRTVPGFAPPSAGDGQAVEPVRPPRVLGRTVVVPGRRGLIVFGEASPKSRESGNGGETE